METPIDYKKALAKCQQLAAKSEMCSFDIKEKLQHWDIAQEHITGIIDQLISENYLDEQRFAIAFVKDKTRFNHWGKIKTTAMLRHKHIQQSIINNALNELDPHEYLTIFNYELKKKALTLKKDSPPEKKRKLANYMLSKGFEPELVFAHVNAKD